MKFLKIPTLLLFVSVTFLYYLSTNTSFLPTNTLGEHDWYNISTVIFLLIAITFSLLSILIYSILTILKKRDRKSRVVYTLRSSLLLTLLLTLFFTLNYFNIFNIIWGASIVLVVLILIFII